MPYEHFDLPIVIRSPIQVKTDPTFCLRDFRKNRFSNSSEKHFADQK